MNSADTHNKNSADTHNKNRNWLVYIIRADDGSLYTGVTTDIERRFGEHQAGPRGARYFQGRRPVEVVFTESGHSRASACRREYEIKKLSRERKLDMLRLRPLSDR